MTPDTGILTHLLQAFLTVFSGGWSALQPSALSLFAILVGLELTLSGLWWALSGDDAVKGLIQKLLVIGLFFFFIQQWPMLTTTTLQSFARVGALAGGASSAPGALTGLTDPSTIVAQGFTVIQPLSDKVDALTQGTWTALKNLGTIMQLGLAMIGILFGFFLLGIQCFLVYLEFYLVAVLSLILLPFGVFRHSAFIAEKAFSAVIAHGIKLMVLAFVIAVAQPVLQQITMPVDFSLRDAWCTLLAVMTICFLAWHAPSMAAGLLAGSPTLNASQATGAALETGGAALLGAAGIAAAGRAALGGVGATISAASALKTGADIGATRATEAGAGPVGQTMGAVSGVAKVAASPLTAMADRMRQRVSEGQLAGWAAHGMSPAPSAPSNGSPASTTSTFQNTDTPAAGGGQSTTVPPTSPPSPSSAASSSVSGAASPTSATISEASAPSRSASATDSASTLAQARHGDMPTEVARMAGDAPAPRAPASPDTLHAARIASEQQRPNEAMDEGLRQDLSARLPRDTAAPEGATNATEAATQVAESRSPPAHDASTDSRQ